MILHKLSDIRHLPIGLILSERYVSDTVYCDCIITVIEIRKVCKSDIREKDILIENIFRIVSL